MGWLSDVPLDPLPTPGSLMDGSSGDNNPVPVESKLVNMWPPVIFVLTDGLLFGSILVRICWSCHHDILDTPEHAHCANPQEDARTTDEELGFTNQGHERTSC